MEYTLLDKLCVWATYIDDIGYKKQNELLDLFVNETNINLKSKSDKIQEIVGKDLVDDVIDSFTDGRVDNILKNIDKMGIELITKFNSKYPKNLLEISTPPILLYCKGNTALLNTKSIAIVGTRRMSRYGRDVTEKFAKSLSNAGYTIVSGLADGVDSMAHMSTLDVKGHTIAVLGSGVNNIYPATNIGLANRILENDGLIISEYKPASEPRSYRFPLRNRIIAGLSRGVLITEATLKSGSMHTKEYALEYGRDLFVVPGRITDIYSAGCNEILKSLQGAIVLDPKDILESYGESEEDKQDLTKNMAQLTLVEQNILDIIGSDDVHINEIAKQSGLDTKDLMTELMRLELLGFIKSVGNNMYRK